MSYMAPHYESLLRPKFYNWLNTIPGIIRWLAADVDGQSVRKAHNWNVAGVVDSALFQISPLNGNIYSATVAQPFSKGLPFAELYDAINDYIDIKSDALDAAWNPTEWTIFGFARNDDAAATERRLLTLTADGSNLFTAAINTSGDIQIDYVAGGTARQRIVALPAATDRFMWMARRSASGDLSLSINAGSLSTIAGVGVWVGTFATAIIGGGSPSTLLWDGLISDTFLANYEITQNFEVELFQRWGG